MHSKHGTTLFSKRERKKSKNEKTNKIFVFFKIEKVTFNLVDILIKLCHSVFSSILITKKKTKKKQFYRDRI